jgi:hypothetical protein
LVAVGAEVVENPPFQVVIIGHEEDLGRTK